MQGCYGESSCCWATVPDVIVQRIAGLLDLTSLQQLRLTCSTWRGPGSLTVEYLKPSMTGCLGLQWHDLSLVTKAFPACVVLDLRSHDQVELQSPAIFKDTLLKTVLLSIVSNTTKKDLKTLRTWLSSASQESPTMTFNVHLHYLPAQLLGSAQLDDRACRFLANFPAAANIVTLDLGILPTHVSKASLHHVAELTKLAALLMICHEDIDDQHLDVVSNLTDLTQLTLGPVGMCSDQGIADALSSLSQLQTLHLTDAVCIEDNTLAMLSKQLGSVLNTLSLSCCPLLSNECLLHLARMPYLTRLFFSKTEHVDKTGVQDLVSQASALVHLDFRGCIGLTVSDRMQLQRELLLHGTARRSSE